MESSLFEREPVLAVCGWSGAGKTTLLERVIPLLVDKGLRIAVVKHDAHGIDIDHEGKDSARLFAAGADLQLSGPSEQIWRVRRRSEMRIELTVSRLLSTHDVVLIEGHKGTALPKVWCNGPDEKANPEGLSGVEATLPWGQGRVAALMEIVEKRIREAVKVRPLFGGVLIGGESRRMGSPKHSLKVGDRSLLSVVGTVLRSKTERIVVLGRGEIPEDVGPVDQLTDAPNSGHGPLAGLLTAMCWAPRVCWVVGACDMPGIGVEALEWLIGQRAPGRWAVLPRDEEGRMQPTLALYEPQARALIESLVSRGIRAPRALDQWSEVHSPLIPGSLNRAWRNVNTPADLQDFCGPSADD